MCTPAYGIGSESHGLEHQRIMFGLSRNPKVFSRLGTSSKAIDQLRTILILEHEYVHSDLYGL